MIESVNFIKSKLPSADFKPEIGLILGSGLGEVANEIEGVRISYSDIPSFEASTVAGHAGQLVLGKFCGKNVVAMQGRFHYYEGHSMQKVVYPVKIMKQLGIDKMIVTNAAGGVNKDFTPGDLMILNDHINLMGSNPLIGKNEDNLGDRFPDMSYAYTKELVELTKETAAEIGLKTKEGVYAALTGPAYETPAEIRMLRTMGADAIGMSTVPEVIMATYMGVKVLGISCITNMAAGILDQPLNHDEVIETTEKVKRDFISLVKKTIEKM